MSITTAQLMRAFKERGLAIQMLSAGADRDRVACTAGTVSLEKLVEAVDLALGYEEVRSEGEMAIIEAAREKWAVPSGDDLLVYDDAKVSQAGDDGVWVEARVFLRHGEF